MATNNRPQVVVLGLDGATFEVIQPLREMGVLPNLDRLMTEGAVGHLSSTMPPVTGPAWFALATGKSPGKTGVFDFRNRGSSNLLSFDAISSVAIRGQAFWDLFSDAGRRVCIVNYPMLYPAYPLNGVMISGLLSPLQGNITYPPALREELDQLTGGYAIDVPFNDPYYADREQELAVELTELLRKRTMVIERLLLQEPWDLFVGVLTVTDMVQHYLWKHWDLGHSQYDLNKSPELGRLFMDIWCQVDGVVGKVKSHLDNDTAFLIVSDHGFGPLEETFHVNEWLCQKGYLSWKASKTSTLNALARSITNRVPGLLSLIPRQLRKSRMMDFARANIEGLVDLSRTRAFMPAVSDICGQIYVNRELCGSFGSQGYGRMVDGIVQLLGHLQDEFEGDLAVEVYKSTDLYHGQYTETAPDILFIINDFRCRVTAQRGSPVMRADSGSPNRTGTHRSNGIFIAWGSELAREYVQDAEIIDIAPTILQLAGLPVPESMDGKILFDAASAPTTKPTEWHEASQGQQIGEYMPESGLSEDEETNILKRLQDLGYV